MQAYKRENARGSRETTKEERHKMKTNHITSIVLGTALVLATAGISRAEPSPDLMNSILGLRREAQKNAKAGVATSKPASAGVTYWSWSRTRNIMAGQGNVAVPDTSHRVAAEGTPGDFKIAPLLQPHSTPQTK